MPVDLSYQLTARRHPLTMPFVIGSPGPTSEHFRSGTCRQFSKQDAHPEAGWPESRPVPYSTAASRSAETVGSCRRRWRYAEGIIFGAQLTSADTTASAAWIEAACQGARATVGELVPNTYTSFLRVHAPPPTSGDWWATYRYLYEAVALIGAQHTSRPDHAWFAVWEGHGFDSVHTQVAWSDAPIDDAERQEREAMRARLRDENRTRTAAIRSQLATVPRFALPDRTYYLMEGPVAAVAALRDPSTGHWRNPDLFWPDDRRWFVATDVDFWSLYVGGSDDFIAELASGVATPTEIVTLATPLEVED